MVPYNGCDQLPAVDWAIKPARSTKLKSIQKAAGLAGQLNWVVGRCAIALQNTQKALFNIEKNVTITFLVYTSNLPSYRPRDRSLGCRAGQVHSSLRDADSRKRG